MWNQKVKEVVQKFDRLYEFYSIGPLQKALFEDMVEEVVTKCAQTAFDAAGENVSASEMYTLILKTFEEKK